MIGKDPPADPVAAGSFEPVAGEPSPWAQTLSAARANLVPGLSLQALALALVLAYYFHPATHQLLDVLAAFKHRLGFRYSIVATAVFGGIIPSLFLRLNPRTRDVTPYSHVLFYILFWAYKGFEVDLLYRVQGWIFGNGVSLAVIAKKVAVDQLLYTPFWSATTAILIYHWKDAGFRLSSLTDMNWFRFQRRNLPKALLATWVVWVPGVAIIYSLPASLQIPLFNIVLCFFSLLYVTLTRKP